jgi:predicted ATPase
LVQSAGIRDDDTLNATWTKLEELLGNVTGESRADKAHYVGYLLGMDMKLSPYIRNFKGTDEQLRNVGRHYLMQFLVATAKQNILVVLWDDIQWADDESLAVITRLVRKNPDIPMLGLFTSDVSLLNRYPSWTRITRNFQHRWLQLLPTDTTDPAFG